jgi:hypothetical protein
MELGGQIRALASELQMKHRYSYNKTNDLH